MFVSAGMLDWKWAQIAAIFGIGATAYKTMDERLTRRRDRIKATFAYLDEWRKPDLTKARYELKAAIKSGDLTAANMDAGFAGLSVSQLEQVRSLSFYLDYLGHCVELGFMDERTVLVMIGGAIQSLWRDETYEEDMGLGRIIRAEREKRKSGYQNGFEHLAALAKAHPNDLSLPDLEDYNGSRRHPLRKRLGRTKLAIMRTGQRWRFRKR